MGEIATIDKYICTTRIDTLQTLHQICFGTTGKTNLLKKNLRQFSGFDFDKDSDEFIKKIEAAQKFDLTKLKGVCDGLQLDKKGSKETICQRILEFLLSPTEIDDEEDDENNSELEEQESEEQESEEEEKPQKKKRGNVGTRNSREEKTKAGRPRRSTAGRAKPELSSYVEYSSSDDEEKYAKKQAVKRKRADDSDSGSDVSFSF